MKKQILLVGGIAALVFALDQMTKTLIVRWIPQGNFIPVIPGLFDIIHTRNPGAAFGFLAQIPDAIRTPFFLIVSIISLSLMAIYFFRQSDRRTSIRVCLALILGGAFGNLWDRITLGEVVDFLSFHWYDAVVQGRFAGRLWRIRMEWPAFNIADSAISIAVLSLVWLMSRKKES